MTQTFVTKEGNPGREEGGKTLFGRQKYAGMALYFWYGMRIGSWFELLKRNGFRITPNCFVQVAAVTLMTPFNSLLYRLSEAIYGGKVRDHEITQPPVFVLGHWRTGTTYLHDLFACDPEFGHPTTYQCFFPNHFLLTGKVARLWFHLTLPEKRPQDNVDVGHDKPQEEEFALCNMGLPSIYFSWALPRRGPVDHSHLDLRDLPAEDKARWKEGMAWFLKRVSYVAGKPLVMKSPTNTARVRALLELYPDARFVHIARDPLITYASTMRLWRTMLSIQGIENPPQAEDWLEDYVLDTFEVLHRRYEEDRPLIPEGHLTEITYEELVADPKGVMRRIYGDLGLGDFGRAEKEVDAYLASNADYKTNRYETDPAKEAQLRTRWADYFKRFGYDRKSGAPAEV
ncbi:MAG: sulfotransferase [Hyphomicrobiales bacterium]